jgi:adenylate cyclase
VSTAQEDRDGGTAGDLERRLLGGERTWRRREVAAEAGVSQVASRKLWRALGFANVSDSDVAFTDADVQALARVARLVRSGALDETTAIALARAIGQSADRLVSWQTEAVLEHLAATGGAGPQQALERLGALVDDLEVLLLHVWRRHLAATVGWLAGTVGEGDVATASPLTVGFADLVSYTRLSQRLDQHQLGVLVQRFEGLASDVVTAGGGRLVKTVGDEVLFVADDPGAGAVIGLSLSEQMACPTSGSGSRTGRCCAASVTSTARP